MYLQLFYVSNKMSGITQERLKELVTYNPDTGIFTNNFTRCGRAKKGDVAGHIQKRGYINIILDWRIYRAHRLAFLYMTGSIPKVIDHKDGNPSNNIFSNLRSCTPSQNARNSRLNSNNTSGVKGVRWEEREQAFRVELREANTSKLSKYFYVKRHESKEHALAAATQYVRAKREELHGEFANHG
jgi:hypothetical protein